MRKDLNLMECGWMPQSNDLEERSHILDSMRITLFFENPATRAGTNLWVTPETEADRTLLSRLRNGEKGTEERGFCFGSSPYLHLDFKNWGEVKRFSSLSGIPQEEAFHLFPRVTWESLEEKKARETEERRRASLPRGAREAYFSFTGHFLAPENKKGLKVDRRRKLISVPKAAEGTDFEFLPSNEAGICWLHVAAADWKKEGFVYWPPQAADDASCCARQPSGHARFYN